MIQTREEIAEAALKHQEEIDAARASFSGWPDSGVQTYRVQFTSDTGANHFHDVEAATGNEAAERVLSKTGGGKITNITPAPRKAKAA